MFINTVNKIRNHSPKNYKYQRFQVQSEDVVDPQIENKISELIIKYESGYILVVEVKLKTGEVIEGIIRRKTDEEIILKTQNEELSINIKNVKIISVAEM